MSVDDPRDGAADDPQLRETEAALRRVLQAEIEPGFRDALRTQLLAEHEQTAGAPIRAARWRRWARRPRRIGAIIVAAALATAVALLFILRGGVAGPVRVAFSSPLQNVVSVRQGAVIPLRSSRALDVRSLARSFRLTPAARVRVTGTGTRLVVTPRSPLAANTLYLLTIDHRHLRTADGRGVAADTHVSFGTAPIVPRSPIPPESQRLAIRRAAPAADGSEAVFTRTGALLATGARVSSSAPVGTVLLETTTGGRRLAAPTSAICVSRSGHSIAYLARAGGAQQLVIANGDGRTSETLPLRIDAGSPLGWIGDAAVSFVSGNRLRAIDRQGRVHVLLDRPVSASSDGITISPGGRYVYVHPPAPAEGLLHDLVNGRTRVLPGIVGDPAFSSDGATIAWIDGRGRVPLLAVRATTGSTTLETRLPAAAGSHVSDLAISPDGRTIVYTLERPGHPSELRLATFPDGRTLASTTGAGASPNWSASGARVAVLRGSGARATIAVAAAPTAPIDLALAAQRTADLIANAQLSGDRGAANALASASLAPDRLGAAIDKLGAQPTRALIVQTTLDSPSTASVRVRLLAGGTPAHPAVLRADETLRLALAPDRRRMLLKALIAGRFATEVPGPHLVHVDTTSEPGQVLLTFDAELDAATVRSAISARSRAGTVRLRTSYDVTTHAVRVTPLGSTARRIVVRVAGLRDIDGTVARPSIFVADVGRR